MKIISDLDGEINIANIIKENISHSVFDKKIFIVCIVNQDYFIAPLTKVTLPLMKIIVRPLAKIMLVPLGLTATA